MRDWLFPEKLPVFSVQTGKKILHCGIVPVLGVNFPVSVYRRGAVGVYVCVFPKDMSVGGVSRKERTPVAVVQGSVFYNRSAELGEAPETP